MKTFRMIKPEDAEVLRDGKWVRYDATSLVPGDIIRLEEGDIVPGDCVVLEVDDDSEQMLVDCEYITGEEKPRTCEKQKAVQLYLGSRVVEGSGLAVVTAIGPNTMLASIIRDKKFPPQPGHLNLVGDSSMQSPPFSDDHHHGDDDDPEVGISLVSSPRGTV